MPLLAYRNLGMAFGGAPLLDDAALSIEKRDRICLLGRNGEGKSTLLRILAGELTPDAGEVESIPGLRVAKLDQTIPDSITGTVFEIVAAGLGPEAQSAADYHRIAHELAEDPENEDLAERLDALQAELDRKDGWSIERRVESLLDRVDLSGDAPFETLSGGNKRRALLARALITEPHILLLDEPTNHLDMPGIQWLETFLSRSNVALLFISHDRAFIRRLAGRVFDLDRGRLTAWECGYDTYLARKTEQLETEAKHNNVFDKKLAEEEAWIRKGVKARRTRNQGRVQTLRQMRRERARRRELEGTANLSLSSGQTSGRKVITVDQLSFRWDDNSPPIVDNFSTTIWRGDKIGIVGLNGSGKTTLLNLLLHNLTPTRGTVTHGTKLDVAYFDQHRAQLDESRSVAENVHPGGETVTVNGRQTHILSYLRDFLFTPQVARSPIRKLSGGQRARLLLARLFLQPANLLVLDEPTNDLDIETVELLEERLLEFNGTLLLVSHDRDFLENVATSTFALPGDGTLREYTGGCKAWLADNPADPPSPAANSGTGPAGATAVATSPAGSKKTAPSGQANTTEKPRRTLSHKEREALEALPATIERLEKEHAALTDKMARPEYYQNPDNDPGADAERLARLEKETEDAYRQWADLEAKSA